MVGARDGKGVQRMNRQEATKILKALSVYECYPKSASEETKEAIDMAIEALQEPKTIIGIDVPYGSDKGIATIFKRKDDKLILEKVKELELMSDWIPVSERLPEGGDDGTEYLVCSADGDIWVDFIFRINEKGVAWWRVIDSNTKVIAWRPLPAPYKESDSE